MCYETFTPHGVMQWITNQILEQAIGWWWVHLYPQSLSVWPTFLLPRFVIFNWQWRFKPDDVIFKVLGPRIMKSRKAMNIEKIQLVHNTLHLLINAYLFKEAAGCSWFAGYSYRCQSVDFSTYGTPLKVRNKQAQDDLN